MEPRKIDHDHLTTYKYRKDGYTAITSRTPFFSQEIGFKEVDGRIEFMRLGVTDTQKRKKFTYKNGIYYTIIIADLPIGKFKFDEDESNEDVLVVYCN